MSFDSVAVVTSIGIVFLVGLGTILSFNRRSPRPKAPSAELHGSSEDVEQREYARILKSLSDLLTSLTQRRQIDEIYDVIAFKTQDILNVQYVAVFIREGNGFVVKGSSGVTVKSAESMRLPVESAFIRYLMDPEKPPAHLNNGHVQLQMFSRMLPGLRDLLCFRLRAETNVFGFILVANKKDQRSFNFHDLELLSYLSIPFALHLHNMMLNIQLEQTYTNTIIAMAKALEFKDKYTRGHSERVAIYSVEFAGYLHVDPRLYKVIEEGARLHDLGKIGVPDCVLLKPDKLTNEEFNTMKNHPEIGYNILKDLTFLDEQARIVRHHHEKYDGTGYPCGLNKDQISENIIIVSLADVFDALTSDRPYRKAMSLDETIAEMVKMNGRNFDPRYLKKFIEFLQQHGAALLKRVNKDADETSNILRSRAAV